MNALDYLVFLRAEAQVREVRDMIEPSDRGDIRNAKPPPEPPKRHCLACGKPHHAGGYCLTHWHRLKRTGDVDGWNWENR